MVDGSLLGSVLFSCGLVVGVIGVVVVVMV